MNKWKTLIFGFTFLTTAGLLPGNLLAAEVAEEPKKGMAAVLGESAESDFVAKHFSFVFGGVMLNQFKIKTVETDGNKTFFLEDGSADAKAFLEAGFRRRWAWLDRDSSLDQKIRKSKELATERENVSKAVLKRRAAQLLLKAAVVSENQKDIATAETDLEKAQVEEAQMRLILETKAEAPKKNDNKKKEQVGTKASMESDSKYKEQVETYYYYSPLCRCGKPSCLSFLIPDDWTVRIGFVFDSGSSSNDTVAMVGASDVYNEIGLGWNLVQWSFPTGSNREAPIRGSMNLEVDGLAYTDDQINDVHHRLILGAAFVFGIPMTSADPDPLDLPDPKTIRSQPVIELLVRGGGVLAEVPEYLSSDTNQLKAQNNLVEYGNYWGLGFDIELNAPITKRLGYIMARSQINIGFDPNPWFISLGYTIPLSTLVSGITPAPGD